MNYTMYLVVTMDKKRLSYFILHAYVIVIARFLGIYGSKPTRIRGRSPRTRAVYDAINP